MQLQVTKITQMHILGLQHACMDKKTKQNTALFVLKSGASAHTEPAAQNPDFLSPV